MVILQKSGDSAVKFVFTDSDHYLYGNGEIEVPVNGLMLVIDESNMVTFKKLSGDPFISFNPANSNLSDKEGVINFYKTNMVGSTGGGSESGITSGEVQTMIDNSLEDYYTDDEVDAALSGKADASNVYTIAETNYLLNDLSQRKADTSALTAVANDVSTLSGQVATKVNTTDFNAYSAATDARIAEDEEVTAAALNNLDETKQDALEYYSENTEDGYAEILITNDDGEGSTEDNHINIGGGIAEIGIYNEYDDGQGNVTANNASIYADQIMVTLQAGITEDGDTTSTEFSVEATGVTINGDAVATEPYVDDVISGKVDTSAITSSITSGSTDSEIPTAKATYDAIQAGGGGGATYSAGTNISIDTANTINCTLPIYSGTGDASVKMGYNGNGDGRQCTASGQGALAHGQTTTASGNFSHAEGKTTTASGNFSHAEGDSCQAQGRNSHAEGNNVYAKNDLEHSQGSYNVSNKANTSFGDSGNTLFSVGNGNYQGTHNAFDIRQNGDLYFADTDNTTYQNFYEKPMVRLQDMYAALGGLKFVQCTQAEYDAMVSGGTVDSSTIYFITNVVS